MGKSKREAACDDCRRGWDRHPCDVSNVWLSLGPRIGSPSRAGLILRVALQSRVRELTRTATAGLAKNSERLLPVVGFARIPHATDIKEFWRIPLLDQRGRRPDGVFDLRKDSGE